MDQISRIRCKNLLDSLLAYCEGAENEEERAVLMRVSVVTLAKLRIHAGVDAMLGYDIRMLTNRVDECSDRVDLLDLWDEANDLLRSYREALA